MDLRQWLVDEIDDATARLRAQVLYLVPEGRRHERPGGGNCITWSCLHIARHADLALAVLKGTDLLLPAALRGGGGALEEEQQPWADGLDPIVVDGYLSVTLAAIREYLVRLQREDLDRVPETPAALAAAGVPLAGYEWLYRMWSDKPASFLVRWPLIGHVGNHVGEMVGTKDRLGLGPI